MKRAYLSSEQKSLFLTWINNYKKVKIDVDIAEKWLQKGWVKAEDLIDEPVSHQYNELIFKKNHLLKDSLTSDDDDLLRTVLYTLIFYPDDSLVPELNEIKFNNNQDEIFKKEVIKFLKNFDPNSINLFEPNKNISPQEISLSKSLKQQHEIRTLLHVDLMEIQIGMDLISLVDESKGGDLLKRISDQRKYFASTLGLIVPSIRIRDNSQLDKNEYQIKIKGRLIGKSKLYPNKSLLMEDNKIEENFAGLKVIEPAFNLPGKWIDPSEENNAKKLGLTVVKTTAVFATHLKEIIKKLGYELLTRQEMKNLIDDLQQTNPVLIDEIIPEKISYSKIHRVLQKLLKDGISIKDLVSIFEIISDYANENLSTKKLTDVIKKQLNQLGGHEGVQSS